jgi:four helix bundle protein
MKLEDIVAWQKAKELVIEINKIPFDNAVIRERIYDASLGIFIHIAQGFERMIYPEFLQHLYLAQENCSAVKSLLYLSVDMNYITVLEKEHLSVKLDETTRTIGGFIKHLKTKIG